MLRFEITYAEPIIQVLRRHVYFSFLKAGRLETVSTSGTLALVYDRDRFFEEFISSFSDSFDG